MATLTHKEARNKAIMLIVKWFIIIVAVITFFVTFGINFPLTAIGSLFATIVGIMFYNLYKVVYDNVRKG